MKTSENYYYNLKIYLTVPWGGEGFIQIQYIWTWRKEQYLNIISLSQWQKCMQIPSRRNWKDCVKLVYSESVSTKDGWQQPSSFQENGPVIFISDFRYLNKCLVRRPYPIPQIANVLQKLQGMYYATSLDLNMCCYTVWLDPDS